MYKLFLRDHAKVKVKLIKYHMKINLVKMASYSKSISNPKESWISMTKINPRGKKVISHGCGLIRKLILKLQTN